MKSFNAFIPALAAIGLCVAAPSQAQEQTSVRYGDLNLQTENGRKHFDRRIRSAVRSVCAGQTAAQNEDLQERMAKLRCRKDTLARANIDRDAVLAAVAKGNPRQLAAASIPVRAGS
jgi:UrcA family protein